MKYRKYKKKVKKDIISRVEKLKPVSGDYIVLYYPDKEYPSLEVWRMFKMITDVFKQNKTLALPELTSLQKCSKEDLVDYLGALERLIKDR